VKVTIEVTLPDYSSRVDIVDPLPGCLEALDDSFFNVPQNSGSWNFRWWWYYYYAFSKEFKADKVVFHGSWLFAGSHTVSYVAVVSSEGKFLLPPAKAFDPTQPEVMGLSTGGVFTTAVLTSGAPADAKQTCLPWRDRGLVYDELPDWLKMPVDAQPSTPGTPSTPETPSSRPSVPPVTPGELPHPPPVPVDEIPKIQIAIGAVAFVLFTTVIGGVVYYVRKQSEVHSLLPQEENEKVSSDVSLDSSS